MFEFLGDKEKILPTVIIVLNILAAIVYAAAGDGRRFTYWAAAAVLQIAVTY